jgi:hypothetical protein
MGNTSVLCNLVVLMIYKYLAELLDIEKAFKYVLLPISLITAIFFEVTGRLEQVTFMEGRRGMSEPGRDPGDLLDHALENLLPHPFHKLDAADHQVTSAADSASRDLVPELPDHLRDVHHHPF